MEPGNVARAMAAASAGAAEEACVACEEAELKVDDANQLGGTFYAVYMLSLMACGKMCEARFVWKRMPLERKSEAEVGAVHRLLRTLWTRNYAQFYIESNGFAWSSATANLVARLHAKTKEDMLALVERSFSVVSLEVLATMTGNSLEAAKHVAVAKGWELSEETGMVTIPDTTNEEQEGLKLEQLEHLSEYVSVLCE
mmetsp:Transcript_6905/g.42141  ORF Transcript_6905/g.42141 Transcript_6905/m.42141 type:complete len:198 (+) Transcript_6905:34-627(+)